MIIEGLPPKVRVRSDPGTMPAPPAARSGDVSRADQQAISFEGGQPHTRLRAAYARVNDLAQSLILEASIGQARNAEVWFV